MDLLNKVAGAAEGVTGVKVDEGEDMKQTMKEKAMEEVMEDKLSKVAGDKVRCCWWLSVTHCSILVSEGECSMRTAFCSGHRARKQSLSSSHVFDLAACVE